MVRRVCLVLLLITAIFSAALPTASGSAPDQPIIARVHAPDAAAAELLIARGLDLLEMRDGDDLFILTTERELAQLQAAGLTARRDDPGSATLTAARDGKTFQGGYRTVPEMRTLLQQAAAERPWLAQYFTYGDSWQRTQNAATGHELFGITLTNDTIPGPKPTFFLMSAIHARELVTSELALRLVEYLLDNYGTDGDVTWLLDEHRIVIVPVANPDGRVVAEGGILHRKNVNPNGATCSVTSSNHIGVDLNRNASFDWAAPGGMSKCSATYPGTSAASEPETQALEALVLSLFPDQRGPNLTDPAPITTTGMLLTLHAYSDLVLWPWGFQQGDAPNGASLARIGTKLASYNGYAPMQSIELYPTHGTTDDWSYGVLGVPSLTFEVGPTSGPCSGFMPPFSCLDGGEGGDFWDLNFPALMYAARIARAPYQLAEGPTVEALSATTLNGTLALTASLSEAANGGQPIAAAELYIDTPPWRGGTPIAMQASDGTFNGTLETGTATTALTPGKHLIYVRARDNAGNWGPVRGIHATDTAAEPPSGAPVFMPLLMR